MHQALLLYLLSHQRTLSCKSFLFFSLLVEVSKFKYMKRIAYSSFLSSIESQIDFGYESLSLFFTLLLLFSLNVASQILYSKIEFSIFSSSSLASLHFLILLLVWNWLTWYISDYFSLQQNHETCSLTNYKRN